MRYNHDPYAIYEALEEQRWQEFYAEQDRIQEHNAKANQIADLFPLALCDFNPKDPLYSQHLTPDYAQELYSEFINKLSDRVAFAMR